MKTTGILIVTVLIAIVFSLIGIRLHSSAHVTLGDVEVVCGLMTALSINSFLISIAKNQVTMIKQLIIISATTPERIDAAKTGKFKLYEKQS